MKNHLTGEDYAKLKILEERNIQESEALDSRLTAKKVISSFHQ